MQNAGTSCARALRIAQYALRSKVSLRKAVTPFRPPSSRHAFFSTSLTDEAHPAPQGAHVESEGKDKAHASVSVDGSVSGGGVISKEYVTELENVLQSSPAQNQNEALPESAPTHTPSPSSHSSARPVRARVQNARGARVAEALALSMFGDSPPRDHEGTQDLRSFAVEQALPLPPEIPPDSRDVLTDEEMRMYLAPLYSRRWSVVFTKDTKGKSQRVLTKMGVFKTDDLAQRFVVEVMRTCLRESTDTRFTISREEHNVTFTTFTPDAVQPGDAERKSESSLSSLTLRDVRLALAVEHLWELQDQLGSTKEVKLELSYDPRQHPSSLVTDTSSSPKATGSPSVPTSGVTPGPSTDPIADKNAKRRDKLQCFRCKGPHHVRDCPEPRRPVTCAACKGLHHVNNCPRRAEIKPSSPCQTCGSPGHWSIDCSGGKTEPTTADGRVQLAHRRCYICGSVKHSARDCTERAQHPPRIPCPLCKQEGHWAYDCPELANHPEFVIKDCSYCGGTHHRSQCRGLKHKFEQKRAAKLRSTADVQ